MKGEEAREARTLSGLRVPIGFGITGGVAESGRSLLLSNSQDCEFGELVPGTEPVDESVVAVPLRYGSRVNGVIFLSQLGVGRFDENDVRLLEVLAGYAASALENARLYESLHREAEHTKAWLEFSDELSSAGSLEAIMDAAVSTIARLLETDQCSLWLEDATEGDFECAASYGYLEEVTGAEIAHTRVTAEAAEEFIRSRKMPFLMTAQELHDWFFGSIQAASLKPVATAPLPQGHGITGWITVRAPGNGLEHFTGERLRLLDGLAYRASMALQRALLYRDQRESASVAHALLEFGREIAPAASGGEALGKACELVARMLGAPRTCPARRRILRRRARGRGARPGRRSARAPFPRRSDRGNLTRAEESFVLGPPGRGALRLAAIPVTRPLRRSRLRRLRCPATASAVLVAGRARSTISSRSRFACSPAWPTRRRS